MALPFIQIENLEQTIRQLQNYSPATRAAANTAVRKTVNWAARQVARGVSARSDVTQRSLLSPGSSGKAKRIYKRFPTRRRAQSAGSVYLGYNPIKTGYVGAIRPWKRGQTPRVRSHRFPGGFVATLPSGHRGIFRRGIGTTAQGIKTKRRKGAPRREPRPLSKNKWGVTTLPIDEQLVFLEESEELVRSLEIDAGPRLRSTLLQELNFQLNVRNRR